MTKPLRWTVWLLFAVIALASSARASSLYIQYEPGPWSTTTIPSHIWTPTQWGWLPDNVTGTPVVNAGNAQVNAWRVTDGSSGTSNPSYWTELISTSAATALSQGWKYTANARYVTEGVTGNTSGPNMGLSVHLGNRAYHLMLDLTPAGDLQASLFDDGATYRVHRLTTGGVGATAFHRFELNYTPSTQLVGFLFDGVLKDQWNGIALTHANYIEWGNSDQAGAAVGVMEFNSVRFELGPFTPLVGDYDGNGNVSSSDYAIWKNTFGSQSSLAADGNGDRIVNAADFAIWRDHRTNATGAAFAIPEPSSACLLLLAMIVGISRRSGFLA